MNAKRASAPTTNERTAHAGKPAPVSPPRSPPRPTMSGVSHPGKETSRAKTGQRNDTRPDITAPTGPQTAHTAQRRLRALRRDRGGHEPPGASAADDASTARATGSRYAASVPALWPPQVTA